jgi:hypothetical protein
MRNRVDTHAVREVVLIILSSLIIVLMAVRAQAETCNVPSTSYPSIQYAVNVSCTDIVLTVGQVYGDVFIDFDRTITIQGASPGSSGIFGTFEIRGPNTTVTFRQVTLAILPADLPHFGLVVASGAEVVLDDVVIGSTDILFEDDFERGNLIQWSSSVP